MPPGTRGRSSSFTSTSAGREVGREAQAVADLLAAHEAWVRRDHQKNYPSRMDAIVIGIDCAVSPRNVGLALGRWSGQTINVEDVVRGSFNRTSPKSL